MKRVVILGAGTAGTIMANRLRRELKPDAWSITIVDRDDDHLYQPGLLFLPFGLYRADDLVRSRKRYLPEGIDFRLKPLERIDPEGNQILFEDGEKLGYDILIIATGTAIAPEKTQGLTGVGWRESVFDFYSLEGAAALQKRLARWEGGRLVVNVVDMPIKCPVAPLEFLFLADHFFTKQGIRDKVEIVYATPLDGAFTKPKASSILGDMLEKRNIKVEPNFAIEAVEGERDTVTSYDGRELDYDLFVTVPLHMGSDLITRSELGDGDGFVPTDKHTLQSKLAENIFCLGDATNLPTSKAGSVAHFQSEVLVDNILRYIDGLGLKADFDGHANCFIETGFGKAILIDFNYDTEPLPGRFPLPGVGPFKLLEESYANHWGKLGFRWVYWNQLIQGKELPIAHNMMMAGKWE